MSKGDPDRGRRVYRGARGPRTSRVVVGNRRESTETSCHGDHSVEGHSWKGTWGLSSLKTVQDLPNKGHCDRTVVSLKDEKSFEVGSVKVGSRLESESSPPTRNIVDRDIGKSRERKKFGYGVMRLGNNVSCEEI